MEIADIHYGSLLVWFVAFHGFFLAVLISVGQLIADWKSSNNWLFFGLFITLGFFQVHYFFHEIGWIDQFVLLNVLPITAFYLLGPLVFFITKNSLIPRFKMKKIEWLHFLPVILASNFTALFIYRKEFGHPALLSGYFINAPVSYVGVSGWLFFNFYLFLSIRKLWKSHILSKRIFLNHPPARIAIFIVLFLILAAFSDLIGAVTNDKSFVDISVVIITLMIIFLFLISFKYPQYHKVIQDIAARETKRRSYLKGVNLDALNAKLNRLMETEEIFIDETISLPRLARKLNVSTHQLSQFINEKRGDSFSVFINRYRVKKAKKMLIAEPDKKILAIAYDAGFQSKSTFNAAFLKIVGMTPHEYRKAREKD